MIAEVIINRTAKKLNRKFDYNVPKEMEDLISIGSKVLVSFANSKTLEEAYVVGFKESSKFQIKDIVKVEFNLSKFQMELADWMAKKYFCTVSDCIKLMLAPGTKTKEKKVQEKRANFVYLKKDIEIINLEIETGKIKSEKHKRLLNFLKENEGVTISEIETFTDCSRAIVKTLEKNGYVEILEQKIERNPLVNKNIAKTTKLKLTEEQNIVFKTIEKTVDEEKFNEFLLYGVTGSGKTEIYLQLIEKIIDKNKNAIVLVPEISLTPQMLDRFIRKIWKRRDCNIA